MSVDRYNQWLGLPPGERPPDPYTLLGLPLFCTEISRIEQAAYLRHDQLDVYALSSIAADRSDCQRLMNEVARARLTLIDPARREAYDRELCQKLDVAYQPAYSTLQLPTPKPTPDAPQTPQTSTPPAPAAPRTISAAAIHVEPKRAPWSLLVLGGIAAAAVVALAVSMVLWPPAPPPSATPTATVTPKPTTPTEPAAPSVNPPQTPATRSTATASAGAVATLTPEPAPNTPASPPPDPHAHTRDLVAQLGRELYLEILTTQRSGDLENGPTRLALVLAKTGEQEMASYLLQKAATDLQQEVQEAASLNSVQHNAFNRHPQSHTQRALACLVAVELDQPALMKQILDTDNDLLRRGILKHLAGMMQPEPIVTFLNAHPDILYPPDDSPPWTLHLYFYACLTRRHVVTNNESELRHFIEVLATIQPDKVRLATLLLAAQAIADHFTDEAMFGRLRIQDAWTHVDAVLQKLEAEPLTMDHQLRIADIHLSLRRHDRVRALIDGYDPLGNYSLWEQAHLSRLYTAINDDARAKQWLERAEQALQPQNAAQAETSPALSIIQTVVEAMAAMGDTAKVRSAIHLESREDQRQKLYAAAFLAAVAAGRRDAVRSYIPHIANDNLQVDALIQAAEIRKGPRPAGDLLLTAAGAAKAELLTHEISIPLARIATSFNNIGQFQRTAELLPTINAHRHAPIVIHACREMMKSDSYHEADHFLAQVENREALRAGWLVVFSHAADQGDHEQANRILPNLRVLGPYDNSQCATLVTAMLNLEQADLALEILRTIRQPSLIAQSLAQCALYTRSHPDALPQPQIDAVLEANPTLRTPCQLALAEALLTEIDPTLPTPGP